MAQPYAAHHVTQFLLSFGTIYLLNTAMDGGGHSDLSPMLTFLEVCRTKGWHEIHYYKINLR